MDIIGKRQLQLQVHLHPDGGFARASFAKEYVCCLCNAQSSERAFHNCD